MTLMEGLLDNAVALILALGLALVGLVLYIVLHRWAHIQSERLLAGRRARYEESATLLMAEELSPVDFVLQVRRRDRLLAEEILAEVAGKFTPDARSHLAPAFAGLGAIARNVARLRSPIWWDRADAASRLGVMGDASVCPHLHPLLSDRQVEVRIAAARSLAALGTDQWVDDLVQSLAEPDLFSGLRVADVILETGPAAIPSLIRFIEAADSPQGRSLAVDILGDIRAREASDILSRALQDTANKEMRAAACRALGRIQPPDATELLIGALQDPAWEVRGQAVRALGQVGDPAAIPHILPLLAEASPWAIYNAAVALSRMGDEGREALRQEHQRMSHRLQILEEILSQDGQ